MLLALHIRLALIKCHISFDLLVLGQRRGVIPRRVLDLGFVRRDGVVGSVTFYLLLKSLSKLCKDLLTFVGAVRFCGGGREGGFCEGGGGEVDVSVDDLVRVGFGDGDAVYGGGCVGHIGEETSCERRLIVNVKVQGV